MWPKLLLTEPMRAEAASSVCAAERPGERLDLDRVAERRRRAVGLDVADAARLDAGARRAPCAITAAWPSTLGAVKLALLAAVVVDRRAADHRVDGVAVGHARRRGA